MKREEVIELMKSSKSEEEWDENCDIVKGMDGGRYPGWWYTEIVMSGLAKKTLAGCGSTSEIQLILLDVIPKPKS